MVGIVFHGEYFLLPEGGAVVEVHFGVDAVDIPIVGLDEWIDLHLGRVDGDEQLIEALDLLGCLENEFFEFLCAYSIQITVFSI